jgi:nitrilase
LSRSLITVAAVQTAPEKTLDANLAQVGELLAEAADRGAKIVVLPENFAYYGRTNLPAIGAQEADETGPVRQFLSQQSRRLGVWIVGGTIPVMADNSKPHARSLVYSASGDCVGHYDKIHLFDAEVESMAGTSSYAESSDYSYGQSVKTLESDYCKLGLTVCYDLRFAELFQQLCQADAQLVTVPAAFTATTGRDHWELLLRTRALENQFFVVGANLVDRRHRTRGLWGGSAIVDPWGTVLASLSDKVGVAVADIDLDQIAQLQQRMPIRQHRRLPLY